jgi:hypothetical protein
MVKWSLKLFEMKKITLILIPILCLLFSCKKECIKKSDNILDGKLKVVTEYPKDSTAGLLRRYYYYYDTIYGNLDSIVITIKYLDNDIYIGTYTVKKINSNTIAYEEASSNRKFKIFLDHKQILEIKEIDTVQALETNAAEIFFTNNKIDSVFDIGAFFTLASNIKLYNFDFYNNNCTSFLCSWLENISGLPINKNSNYILSYSAIKNPNNLRFQTIGSLFGSGGGDNAGVMNFIVYMLGIDGYYVLPPNNNLIDSFRYNNDYLSTYHYTTVNNKITKMVLNENTIDEFINIMSYY